MKRKSKRWVLIRWFGAFLFILCVITCVQVLPGAYAALQDPADILSVPDSVSGTYGGPPVTVTVSRPLSDADAPTVSIYYEVIPFYELLPFGGGGTVIEGPLTFGPGETSKTITLPMPSSPAWDIWDGDQVFFIRFKHPNRTSINNPLVPVYASWSDNFASIIPDTLGVFIITGNELRVAPGEVLPIIVRFTNPVVINNAPALTVQNGAGASEVLLPLEKGTTYKATYLYTVKESDIDPLSSDRIMVKILSLDTVTDYQGNTLSFNAADSSPFGYKWEDAIIDGNNAYMEVVPQYGDVTADKARYLGGETVVVTVPITNANLLNPVDYPMTDLSQWFAMSIDGGNSFLPASSLTYNAAARTIQAAFTAPPYSFPPALGPDPNAYQAEVFELTNIPGSGAVPIGKFGKYAAFYIDPTPSPTGDSVLLMPTVVAEKGNDAAARWTYNQHAGGGTLYKLELFDTQSPANLLWSKQETIAGSPSVLGFTVPSGVLTDAPVPIDGEWPPAYRLVLSAYDAGSPTASAVCEAALIIRPMLLEITFKQPPLAERMGTQASVSFTVRNEKPGMPAPSVTVSWLNPSSGAYEPVAPVSVQPVITAAQPGTNLRTVTYEAAFATQALAYSAVSAPYRIAVSANNPGEPAANATAEITYVSPAFVPQIQIDNHGRRQYYPNGATAEINNRWLVEGKTSREILARYDDLHLVFTMSPSGMAPFDNDPGDRYLEQHDYRWQAAFSQNTGGTISAASHAREPVYFATPMMSGPIRVTVSSGGFRAPLDIRLLVNSLVQQLYIFNTGMADTPTQISYTNGRGTYINTTIRTDDQGRIAIYEPSGISESCYVNFRTARQIGSYSASSLASGERVKTVPEMGENLSLEWVEPYPVNHVKMKDLDKGLLFLKDRYGRPIANKNVTVYTVAIQPFYGQKEIKVLPDSSARHTGRTDDLGLCSIVYDVLVFYGPGQRLLCNVSVDGYQDQFFEVQIDPLTGRIQLPHGSQMNTVIMRNQGGLQSHRIYAGGEVTDLYTDAQKVHYIGTDDTSMELVVSGYYPDCSAYFSPGQLLRLRARPYAQAQTSGLPWFNPALGINGIWESLQRNGGILAKLYPLRASGFEHTFIVFEKIGSIIPKENKGYFQYLFDLSFFNFEYRPYATEPAYEGMRKAIGQAKTPFLLNQFTSEERLEYEVAIAVNPPASVGLSRVSDDVNSDFTEAFEGYTITIPGTPMTIDMKVVDDQIQIRAMASKSFIPGNEAFELLTNVQDILGNFDAAFNLVKDSLSDYVQTPSDVQMSMDFSPYKAEAFVGFRAYLQGVGTFTNDGFEFQFTEGAAIMESSGRFVNVTDLWVVRFTYALSGHVSTRLGIARPSDSDMWVYKNQSNKMVFFNETKLTAGIEVTGAVGLDIKLASFYAGIRGKLGAGMYYGTAYRPYLPSGDLRKVQAGGFAYVGGAAEFFVEGSLLFVKHTKTWPIAKYGVERLFPNNATNPYYYSRPDVSSDISYKWASTTDPLQNASRAKAAIFSIISSASAQALWPNAYPRASMDSAPVYTRDGDIMAYLGTGSDPDSPADDRVEWMQGQTDRGAIRQGAATPDTAFDLAGSGGFAVAGIETLTGDNLQYDLDNEDPVQTVAYYLNKTEIVGSVWNGMTWTSTQLSNNELIDMNPKTAANADKGAVAWVSGFLSADSDLENLRVNINGELVYRTYANGVWNSRKTIMALGGDQLADYHLAMADDGTIIAALTVQEKDAKNLSVRYAIIPFDAAANAYQDPMMFDPGISGGPAQAACVAWPDGSKAFLIGYYTEDGHIALKAVNREGIGIGGLLPLIPNAGSNFKFVKSSGDSPDHLSVLWPRSGILNKPDGSGVAACSLYGVKFYTDGASIGVSSAQKLFTLERLTIFAFDAYRTQGSGLKAAYVTKSELDYFALMSQELSFVNRITAGPPTFIEGDMIPGNRLPVLFTAANDGCSPITGFTITIDGQATAIPVTLLPGGQTVLTAYYDVPTVTAAINYDINALFADGSAGTASGTINLDRVELGVKIITQIKTQTGYDVILGLYSDSDFSLKSGHRVSLGIYEDVGETVPFTAKALINNANDKAMIDGSGYTKLFSIPYNETTKLNLFAVVSVTDDKGNPVKDKDTTNNTVMMSFNPPVSPPSELPMTGDSFPIGALLAFLGAVLPVLGWLGFRMRTKKSNA